jgi:hypothetical protein
VVVTAESGLRGRKDFPMRLSRLSPVLALVAAMTVLAGEAQAQGFFERLFGLRPVQPMYPPGNVPQPSGPRAPAPGPLPGGPPEEAGVPSGPVQPAAPPPPKPVVLKPPTEESVVGRELKLNGGSGSLRLDRAGRELKALITLAGRKLSQETESCAVKLGGGEALSATSLGKPEGLPRYELQAPACPITFDVLDGAVLVTAPTDACVIQEADCSVEPRGLWGPEPASLLPRAKDIEQARGAADKAVRENYKVLTQRAGPQGVRPVVAEQASFSSERETLCRSYLREGAHGFCNTRFTEGRAVALAARLGILAPTAEASTQPERRPARPPRQAAQPLNPWDPAARPSDIR